MRFGLRIRKIRLAQTYLHSSDLSRPLPTASRTSAFTHICQPRPVARSADSTSGSNLRLTGNLVTAATLPIDGHGVRRFARAFVIGQLRRVSFGEWISGCRLQIFQFPYSRFVCCFYCNKASVVRLSNLADYAVPDSTDLRA